MLVLASVDSYYLVSDGVLSGFVSKDDGSLMECDKTHRQYDQYLMYNEYAVVIGDQPASPRITKDEAVSLVKAEILRRYKQEFGQRGIHLMLAELFPFSV